MSATNQSMPPAHSRLGLPFIALVLVLSAVTVGGIIATDGNPLLALAPVGAIAVLYVLAKVPLRYPAFALLFFGLTLENPGEILATGKYQSPLYQLGWLLLGHWNVVIPYKPLFFSGLDLVLVLFFSLALYRRATRSRIDSPFVETASPMRSFAWVTIFGIAAVEAWGSVHGGMDFANSYWQVERAAYLPLFFLAFHYAFRGPRDQVVIGQIIIVAALLRAGLAWWLRHFFTPNTIDLMPTATTHSDSMLFAGAFCLLIALVLEIPTRKNKLLCLVTLPILTVGMIANNRRLVWVEVALALGILFFMMPMTPLKRGLIRWTLIAAPLVALYLVIGWDNGGEFFRGASVVRSLVDSKSDGSTEWRDFENLDLIATLKTSPLFGLGYGHKYIGNTTDVYIQEHFLPHNSMLGLWAFGGIIGFALTWMFLPVGAFVACRAYNVAQRPIDRVVALSVLQMLMIYINQCYGDLGMGPPTGVLLMAASLSVVGKLALTTGAWPSKANAPIARPVPS
jgi:hypothetical protein